MEGHFPGHLIILGAGEARYCSCRGGISGFDRQKKQSGSLSFYSLSQQELTTKRLEFHINGGDQKKTLFLSSG